MPVLVMEQLNTNLDNLLETSLSIPLTLKRSLLADVARGLLHLHTHNPPIVHRDLSARNILLTSSLVAKISDLGNARIINLRPGQLARTLSRIPGTLAYMPPEAFDEPLRYGSQLDIFSFGHLALFTFTQVRKKRRPFHHCKNTWVISTTFLELSQLHQCDQGMPPNRLIESSLRSFFFSYIS